MPNRTFHPHCMHLFRKAHYLFLVLFHMLNLDILLANSLLKLLPRKMTQFQEYTVQQINIYLYIYKKPSWLQSVNLDFFDKVIKSLTHHYTEVVEEP